MVCIKQKITMKSRLALMILAFVVGAVVGGLFSPIRFAYVSAGATFPAIYRTDRLTGRTSYAVAGSNWVEIQDRATPAKSISAMSDAELLEAATKAGKQ